MFHKQDQTAAAELIASIPNTNSQFHKSNISLPVQANNNLTRYSHGYNGLQYHTLKQRPGDFCYACYDASYNTEGISRTYFENLGKEIINNTGLDSFEGIYAASHYTPHNQHQH